MQGKTIWLTGLSGAGKSTIAQNLVEFYSRKNERWVMLDGDETRNNLCVDLSFNLTDRTENIRRISCVAKLLNTQGFWVVCALISPLITQRNLARNIIGNKNFLEIFISTSLQTCEIRDVKGLYKNARHGDLKNFTGITSPYEHPISPMLTLNTEFLKIQECVNKIDDLISKEQK